jgi:uncharacterized membrane protein
MRGNRLDLGVLWETKFAPMSEEMKALKWMGILSIAFSLIIFASVVRDLVSGSTLLYRGGRGPSYTRVTRKHNPEVFAMSIKGHMLNVVLPFAFGSGCLLFYRVMDNWD